MAMRFVQAMREGRERCQEARRDGKAEQAGPVRPMQGTVNLGVSFFWPIIAYNAASEA